MVLGENSKKLMIGVLTVVLAFVLVKILREKVPAVGQYI